MAYVSRGVHDLVRMADCELCCVSFEGGDAVAEVGCGAVEGCVGEVMHRGDGGANCPADLALEDIEQGVAEEAELEMKCFPMRSYRMTRILRD
jgi:hypothetical protein